MTYEEEQVLLTQNAEMKKQLDSLTTAIKALTQPEPQHVKADDLSAGRVMVNPLDVASGKVIVDFPEPEEKEPRQLKANEILKSDTKRIAANLEKIASGELIVVD